MIIVGLCDGVRRAMLPGRMPRRPAPAHGPDPGADADDRGPSKTALKAQAHALQAIFMNLARRATTQEYMKHCETYLRMAMKAQNQCRMTLETLATIKNPPVVVARQANINNGGQQQVNNGTAPAGHPPAHAANV